MKLNFKFLTFCLIATLLAISYRPEMFATKKKPLGYKPKTSTAAISLAKVPVPKTIKQGTIIAPKAGTSATINELLTLIKPAYFVVYENKASRSAHNFPALDTWLQENLNTTVTLKNNPQQISLIQQNGALPTQTYINNLSKYPALKNFLQTVLNRYSKLLVSFSVTVDGKEYNVFLADPWPGKIKIGGRIFSVPAYTNVLTKWKVSE